MLMIFKPNQAVIKQDFFFLSSLNYTELCIKLCDGQVDTDHAPATHRGMCSRVCA